MAVGAGDGVVPAGYGAMRASTADRERAVDVLKAAFAEGRLDQIEYADRVGVAYSSRTYAELPALTADLPIGPLGTVLSVPAQAMAGQPVALFVPAPPVPRGQPAWYPNNMAFAAFLLGLGAFVTSGLTGPMAIVLAIGAGVQMHRTGEPGAVLATAAVVLAIAQLVFFHSIWFS